MPIVNRNRVWLVLRLMFAMMTDDMQTSQLTTTGRTANWMIGLGVFYGLVGVLLGCVAVFMFGEANHGGDWSGVAFVLGLLAGGVMLWVLGVGITLFVLQRFVRQGRRGAITGAVVVCWLAVLLQLIPVVLASIGNPPDTREIFGIGLAVMMWMVLHLPVVWQLRKARSIL